MPYPISGTTVDSGASGTRTEENYTSADGRISVKEVSIPGNPGKVSSVTYTRRNAQGQVERTYQMSLTSTEGSALALPDAQDLVALLRRLIVNYKEALGTPDAPDSFTIPEPAAFTN